MQGASGADDKVHCSMLGFSIPLHQVIIRTKLLAFFIDMSSRRSMHMGIIYVMLILNLSPHLFFLQLLVIWARTLIFSTTVWQTFYHRSTIPLTTRHFPGCTVLCCFYCYFCCTGHSREQKAAVNRAPCCLH